MSKKIKERRRLVLVQREKGAGMGEGQWVRIPSVMHVMRLCFLLTALL